MAQKNVVSARMTNVKCKRNIEFTRFAWMENGIGKFKSDFQIRWNLLLFSGDIFVDFTHNFGEMEMIIIDNEC